MTGPARRFIMVDVPARQARVQRSFAMAYDDVVSGPAHPLIESDHIEGTPVYDVAGKSVGTIQRLVIEKVSGHIA